MIDNKDIINRIISGYENNTHINGGSCGYGDYLALDDFVSAKFMGESIGISENVIIFSPIDVEPRKVFATTEIEKIFANDSLKYINGIFTVNILKRR